MSKVEPSYTMTPYLNKLEQIAGRTRTQIGDEVVAFFKIHHIDNPSEEQVRAMFLAALDGMADLIQYGKLGSAAIGRLHDARKLCGVPLQQVPQSSNEHQ